MKNSKDSKNAILETQWTVILHIGEMLVDLGPHRVGLPHIRPLESKLWEMRMTGRDGIARAVYAAVQGAHFAGVACVYKKDADNTTKVN